MNTTLSNAQRQTISRAKKKSNGFVRLTLCFDGKTAARMRRLAKSNMTTQANIVQAALLLFDNQQLLKDIKDWATERKTNDYQEWPASGRNSGLGKA